MKSHPICKLLIIFVAFTATARAQFYDGHQQTFGKNRVQYADYYWRYLPFNFGQVYFTQDGETIARQVGLMMPEIQARLAQELSATDKQQWKIIIYNKHSDYLQRNMGLVTGSKETNTGGQTSLIQPKLTLYFNGNYQDLHTQLSLKMARHFIREQLFGTRASNQWANQTVMELPPWFIEGAARYFAQPQLAHPDLVANYLANTKNAPFWPRNKKLQPIIAQSLFAYIAMTYSPERIPDIIAFTRLYNNPEKAFYATIGKDFKQLKSEWRSYYAKENIEQNDKNLLKSRKNATLYHAALSPKADKLAYISEQHGKKKVIFYHLENKKRQVLWQGGFRTVQAVDKSHPVVTWLPDNTTLAFITEEEGSLRLYFYDTQSEELRNRNFPYFEKIQQFRFSPTADKFVLAGIQNGQQDIFEFLLASNSLKQYTHDLANDSDPVYLSKNAIVFASDRDTDSLQLSADYNRFRNSKNLYQFNPGDTLLTRMTYEPEIAQKDLWSVNNNILFTEQRGEESFLSLATVDSTILAIDTAIHYRYLLKTAHLFSLPATFQAITAAQNRAQFAMVKRQEQRTIMSRLHSIPAKDSLSFRAPYFHREEETKNIDTPKYQQNLPDSIISIHNYIFEIEKPDFATRYPERYQRMQQNKDAESPEKYRIYPTSFYIQQIGSQVDFNYIQQAYQPFTGGAVYPTPGISGFFKLGAYDLFEDYKLTAGLKFSADLSANEYIFSVEYLKKRWNKHLTFYRQSLKKDIEGGKLTSHSNQLHLDLSYPFNEVQRVVFTFGGRSDRIVPLATNRQSLIAKVEDRWWAQAKVSYVYDNSLKLTENIYQGLRAKLFIETHQQINNLGKGLYVTGLDIRHYLPIHRELIWANRLAYSSSWGNQRLVYYLGGVDNWVNFSSNTPLFIPLQEIPLAKEVDYQFQAIATNMRGFSQNIRNGSSFAVLNSEIRWPIFRYFIQRPINSSLINHFQWVGFFDIGTAWSGLHPWDSDNAYDEREVVRGPITVRVDTERSPFVAGYGAGLRTKLLGYFMRFDYAWGYENGEITPGIFYFSLSLDF